MVKAKRKRAPGGGRKATGDFAMKTATFSTRITQETRDRLDHAAKTSANPRLRKVSQMAEYLLVGGLDRLASNRARDERPHLDALFAVLRGEIDYVASKYGADFPAEYAARWEIAEILTEQLARKLPGLHSVTITLFDKNGEPSIGIKGYSEKGAEVEARDRDLPQAIVSGPGPFRKAIADAIKAYNDRLGDENAPTDLGALRDTRNERQ